MNPINSRWRWPRYFCLSLLCVAFSARADVECTDQPECWPEGSAMHTGLMLAQQREAIEQQLALKHNELVKLVGSATPQSATGERVVHALNSQHQAWLKYRVQECELVGALTGAGGTWPSTYAVRCETNLTDLRLRRVRYALRCVKKLPAQTRGYEQNRCLQQLAPLVNG